MTSRGHALASEHATQQPDSDQVPPIVRAPWFVNTNTPSAPILVAESSDSAFATRLRQVISDTQQNHFPRVDYASDDHIQSLADVECLWPRPARARFLVDTTVKRLGRHYHVLLPSAVLGQLESHIRCPDATPFAVKCKLWAVFSIGELYAARTFLVGSAFPGLNYFAKATKIMHITPERPSTGEIETRLLLASLQLGPRPHTCTHLLTRVA